MDIPIQRRSPAEQAAYLAGMRAAIDLIDARTAAEKPAIQRVRELVRVAEQCHEARVGFAWRTK